MAACEGASKSTVIFLIMSCVILSLAYSIGRCPSPER